MRTIEVNATSSQYRKEVVLYAYNGQCSIELTDDQDVARCYPEAIELRVWVSDMFPGTDEEWYDYIYDCVVSDLRGRGLLCTVDQVYDYIN